MYDRRIGDKTLSFEASGALMNASLVMRDRETDSWWSIMTSEAIGGDLEGTDLEELPSAEKATWKAWKERYPETRVLSVEGVEHVEDDPYANYFTGDRTFRGMEIEDDRLTPKASIFAFWWQGKPYAAPHAAFEGGKLLPTPGESEDQILFYRTPGASVFESTRAYRISGAVVGKKAAAELLPPRDGELPPGFEPITGFDTFWYTWVSVHPETGVLR